MDNRPLRWGPTNRKRIPLLKYLRLRSHDDTFDHPRPIPAKPVGFFISPLVPSALAIGVEALNCFAAQEALDCFAAQLDFNSCSYGQPTDTPDFDELTVGRRINGVAHECIVAG